MRIAMIGAGAISGYFGGRLAGAGEDVVFIARGRHLEALRGEGLRLDSPRGDLTLDSVQATDDPGEVGPVDAVIVGVKAWQVSEAAPTLRPLMGDDTAVLPLQNGVEAPAQLAEALGEEHVLAGLARIIAFVERPGHIVHVGVEPSIILGELDNRDSERVRGLRSALEKAGVKAEIPPDIHVERWQKFLFIASVSGLGALTRVTLGEVRSQEGTRRLVEGAMREIYAVGRARGVNLPEDAVERSLAFLDGVPEEGTPSMQRDIMEGRPSELEAQSGAVVRLGAEVGVETPLHSFIYNCLLPMERRARGQGDR